MITSTNNNQIKNIISLNKKARERKAQRLFVVEGLRAVSEVPVELISAIYYVSGFDSSEEGADFIFSLKKKENSILFEEVAPNVFKTISDTVTPQGILAVVRMQNYTLENVLGIDKGLLAHIIILESLQDPGNMGTIIRSAEGAGATGIIINNTSVDFYSPKVVRATMGSIFRVPHIITDDLPSTIKSLKNEYGISIFAAHLKGEHYYDEMNFKVPVAFMIGNEGNGLTDEISSLATAYVKIPMEGRLESLNASVAASLLMYETHRQRKDM